MLTIFAEEGLLWIRDFTVAANVVCGSAEHPMTAAHHISWIYLQTQKGGQRRALTIDDKPEAKFALVDGDKPVAVFAYCNLHGLWVTEL